MFRSLTLAAAIAALTISAASAADVIKTPRFTDYTTTYDAPINWTGFYVGLNGGHAGGNVSESNPMYGPSGNQFGEFSPKGWFVGGTVGANWQFAERWVFGLEGDLNYGRIGASRSDSYSSLWYSATETQTVSANWWGTARGRLGFLLTKDLMIYGTGGVIFANIKTSDTSGACSPWWGCYSSDSTTSDRRTGWTIGGGFEYALSNRWSAKAEYLYANMGLRDNRTSYGDRWYSGAYVDKADLHEHIMRVGLNYHF
jgi:outer membrane immunogenic protein